VLGVDLHKETFYRATQLEDLHREVKELNVKQLLGKHTTPLLKLRTAAYSCVRSGATKHHGHPNSLGQAMGYAACAVLCRDEAKRLWQLHEKAEALGISMNCVVHEWRERE
ncbi:redox-regulatory protein, partial [Haematococcus lacustris]